jgi:lipoic acid synthetase
MKDLRDNGCDVITIGQYLQPTKKHLSVHRFVHPDEFAEFREIGYGLDWIMWKAAPWFVLLIIVKGM